MNTRLKPFQQAAAKLKNLYGVSYSNLNDHDTAAWFLNMIDQPTVPELKDLCTGAAICRWHGYAIKTLGGVSSDYDYDEAISLCWRGIQYAIKYKAYNDPEKHVNADQAVKKCIQTILLQDNYNLNLDKSKINTCCQSLDIEVFETTGSASATIGDTVADENDRQYQESTLADSAVHTFIQSYINKKKIVEAIIFDTIAFNDLNRHSRKAVDVLGPDGKTRKGTQLFSEFWPYKCVQLLGQLPTTYTDYFGNTYNVSSIELNKALDVIRQANNQKLYKYLRAALADARANPGL